jgi:tetratricopeptide (TPR) repeat protein
MTELPEDISTEVERLSEEGNKYADADKFEKALGRFLAAYQLLPEPRENWEAAMWLLGSIGDMEFQMGKYAAAREVLMTAMKFFDEAPGNPFLSMRLGQCMYELGEKREAANWLSGAFMLEGMHLFGDEDPKYVKFIKSKLEPPPGGWPKGW